MLIPIGFFGGGAAAGAYELISTTILTTNPSTFTFSSIPGTYKHLQIRIEGSSNGSNGYPDYWGIQLNGSTSAIYSSHRMLGNGASVSSSANSSNTEMSAIVRMGDNPSANRTGAAIIDLLDYASTLKNKTVRAISGSPVQNSQPSVMIGSGLWASTSAITSITIIPGGGAVFGTKSRFSLYGILG
jgi:hypothetical protein